MTTALILRPPDAPKIWVLEVDGPRHQHRLRETGYYRLATNNQPPCDFTSWNAGYPLDPRLKDWGEPHWEVYQLHDGSVEIHACRPTHQEMLRGDLHGRWGAVIRLGNNPKRRAIRRALQIARVCCRCIPTLGFAVPGATVLDFDSIETEIPILIAETGARFPQPNHT